MTDAARGSEDGQRGGEIAYRQGREEDLRSTAAVYKSALGELYRRRNLPEVTAPESVPLHRHLLRGDPARFWVAEADGELVGFGAGLVRGDWWYLAALFVRPDVQGRGVGGALLRRARTGAPPAGFAATITDAIQPVSNTLYAHHGLVPWLPILGLVGSQSPQAQADRSLPKGCDLASLDVGLLGEVRRIDLSVTGLDRTVDHRYLLSGDGDRQGWLLRRHGRPVGYVFTSPAGLIGPAASIRPGDMALLLRSALAILGERGVERVSCAVPGPNLEAQRVLLGAGLVYEECPGLLLASRPFGRFDRYVIAAYGLM